MIRQSETKKATRRRYSQEFKTEALALAVKVGGPEATKELGLHESQLCSWRTRVRAERNRSESERAQAAEIARQKRRLAEREEELAIAKKAAVYFAKSLK